MLIDGEIRRLRGHWTTYWPGADDAAMGGDLRRRFAEAVDAWNLGAVRILAGGVVGLVAAGADVVRKVQPRGHEEEAMLRAEGVALARWGTAGLAPGVHDTRDDGMTVLMERVLPGDRLDVIVPPVAPDERLSVIGAGVRRLHEVAPPAAGVPRLRDTVPHWRRTLAAMPVADAGAAVDELEELLAPSGADVLVHGDLHGGNVLRHTEGWRVIDPHATVGDRHADVWALIDPSCIALPPQDVRRRLGVYTEAADLEPQRAGRWLRLRATIEARDIRAAPVEPSRADAAWATWLEAVAAELRA